MHRFLDQGYVIVPDFLSVSELARARENLHRYYPSAEELSATPERYGGLIEDAEHLQNEFPFAGDALNDISTHPDLIEFVERALGTRDVLLSQAAIWAKYAGSGDFDQGMHLDYQGNSLVVPRDDGAFRQVNMILYYTDVTAAMGPTCVVPKDKTHDLPLWPPFRTRKNDPAIYRAEKKVLVKAGALLLFGMSTFHRASAMTADFGVRFSHHLVWRSAIHAFQGYHQWSQMGEKRELGDFIQRATPRQREVLGFPPPGHEYWTPQTIAAVAMRYQRMDMTPYRRAAAPRGSTD
jgi:ectoine hydroxylase-related dioxygenase (phytanoyl-CoA dioxygenase family)